MGVVTIDLELLCLVLRALSFVSDRLTSVRLNGRCLNGVVQAFGNISSAIHVVINTIASAEFIADED